MRRVIVANQLTVDGFFAGPNGELDWPLVDEEFNEYALETLNSADALLFGRVTYQGMAAYWPSETAIRDDPVVADKMNNLPKIVFSKTLEKVEWKNSRLVKGDIAEEITRLKQQPGKDLVIFGSGSIVSTLTQLGLIDEYWILVHPIILGGGKPMFNGLTDRLKLKLLRTKTFGSGVVVLYYEPRKGI